MVQTTSSILCRCCRTLTNKVMCNGMSNFYTALDQLIFFLFLITIVLFQSFCQFTYPTFLDPLPCYNVSFRLGYEISSYFNLSLNLENESPRAASPPTDGLSSERSFIGKCNWGLVALLHGCCIRFCIRFHQNVGCLRNQSLRGGSAW